MSQKKEETTKNEFAVDLDLKEGTNFQFDVDFHIDVPNLLLDESKDSGGDGAGPGASRLIGAAVGNCLSASLLFCLRKARVDVTGIHTSVKGTIARNEEGYWRIQNIDVDLQPTLPDSAVSGFKRCQKLFENYCIVTESVRHGIPVSVTLSPKEG
ncbi:MAG: OsmC family protein [Candidatus Hodarchaeota archaeon]